MPSLPVQFLADRLLQGRALLLRSLAAVTGREVTGWPELLQGEAQLLGLNLQWRGMLHDEPSVAAVRVAHALEMGVPGLQAWTAAWPSAAAEPAPLQLAASAAGLLAGREALQLLVAATHGGSEDCGALIDGESCARMAVAGFDPETEVRLGNCSELLASAGDLVNRSAAAGATLAATRFLILGLKWHAPAGN